MATVTARQVRTYLAERPAIVATLSEQAQANLRSRGVLSEENIKAYNRKRSKDRRYVPGNSTKVAADRKAQRAALVEQGLAGKRGPLSKEARKALRG